jgi:hypothetical protein
MTRVVRFLSSCFVRMTLSHCKAHRQSCHHDYSCQNIVMGMVDWSIGKCFGRVGVVCVGLLIEADVCFAGGHGRHPFR